MLHFVFQIMNERNLDQLLKLAFSIILSVKGAFNYAVQVLRYLISHKTVQQFLFTGSNQLESYLSRTTGLLTTCTAIQLPEVSADLLFTPPTSTAACENPRKVWFVVRIL